MSDTIAQPSVFPQAAHAREAPSPIPLHCGLHDPSHPGVANEPVLDVDEIQGNILGGFSKDFQTLLFLKITHAHAFRHWLRALVPFIATSAEVIAFNRLFKAVRSRRKRETNTVKATWINIAFSHQAFTQLTTHIPNLLATDFVDEAFRAGLAARSPGLGDPLDTAAEGNPDNWVVGGANNAADVILIVASDDPEDMDDTVADLLAHLQGAVEILNSRQDGATLQGDLRGHEHFGFLDGVSQPGLRGRLSDNPHDVLTPRQNPNNRDQGKPGQDLLWPGEFVFGYPGQKADAASIVEPGPLTTAGPRWAKNGAFLVFRRLRQDVFAFHSFLKDTAQNLNIADPNQFGAKLVGRWHTGAPVLRTPDVDNKPLADDDCANNNFEFQEGTDPVPPAGWPNAFDCIDDVFPLSPGDKEGKRCPFAGHIRKAYPRDDVIRTAGLCEDDPEPEETPCGGESEGGSAPEGSKPNEEDTQTHRLLRRGIPFGIQSESTPDNPILDEGDRGLLFMAYQTSIVEQFEFVTKCWVNEPDFKDGGAGHDMIIGQNNKTPDRERHAVVRYVAEDGTSHCEEIVTQTDWVIPTGGGYFFAPSISALKMLGG